MFSLHVTSIAHLAQNAVAFPSSLCLLSTFVHFFNKILKESISHCGYHNAVLLYLFKILQALKINIRVLFFQVFIYRVCILMKYDYQSRLRPVMRAVFDLKYFFKQQKVSLYFRIFTRKSFGLIIFITRNTLNWKSISSVKRSQTTIVRFLFIKVPFFGRIIFFIRNRLRKY